MEDIEEKVKHREAKLFAYGHIANNVTQPYQETIYTLCTIIMFRQTRGVRYLQARETTRPWISWIFMRREITVRQGGIIT